MPALQYAWQPPHSRMCGQRALYHAYQSGIPVCEWSLRAIADALRDRRNLFKKTWGKGLELLDGSFVMPEELKLDFQSKHGDFHEQVLETHVKTFVSPDAWRRVRLPQSHHARNTHLIASVCILPRARLWVHAFADPRSVWHGP